MNVCVYAHTYIWGSDTCPQRRFSFSLSPPDRLWGIRKTSFSAQGIYSVHADGLLWSTGTVAHSYRCNHPPRLKRQSCACGEETDYLSHVQTWTHLERDTWAAAPWAIHWGTVVGHKVLLLLFPCKGYILCLGKLSRPCLHCVLVTPSCHNTPEGFNRCTQRNLKGSCLVYKNYQPVARESQVFQKWLLHSFRNTG